MSEGDDTYKALAAKLRESIDKRVAKAIDEATRELRADINRLTARVDDLEDRFGTRQ